MDRRRNQFSNQDGNNQKQLLKIIATILLVIFVPVLFYSGGGILILVLGVLWFRFIWPSLKKKQGGNTVAPPRVKQDESCTNPEPHRHFDLPPLPVMKPNVATDTETCTNPEPHRHFDAPKPPVKPAADPAVQKSIARQQAAQKKQDAAKKRASDADRADRRMAYNEDQMQRRLKNLRNLYDAGLLTDEEYRDEVRRNKNM